MRAIDDVLSSVYERDYSTGPALRDEVRLLRNPDLALRGSSGRA